MEAKAGVGAAIAEVRLYFMSMLSVSHSPENIDMEEQRPGKKVLRCPD